MWSAWGFLTCWEGGMDALGLGAVMQVWLFGARQSSQAFVPFFCARGRSGVEGRGCQVLQPPVLLCHSLSYSSSSCTSATRAVLVAPARHLSNILKHWGAPRITSKKVKHQDWKTRGSGSTLYKQCRHLALEQKLCAQHRAAPP